MKHPGAASAALILIGVLLFISSCGPDTSRPVTPDSTKSSSSSTSGSQSANLSCLGSVVLEVLSAFEKKENGFTYKTLLNLAPICADAAYSFLSSLSPTNTPSTDTNTLAIPSVTIHESDNETIQRSSTDSGVWNNCNQDARTIRFFFTVPFVMLVGSSDKQYNSSPSGSSNSDLIARQLFELYQSTISGSTTSGPGAYVDVQVPANSQISLTLPINIQFKTGAARLNQDGNSIVVPWSFVHFFQQNGDIVSHVTPCQ